MDDVGKGVGGERRKSKGVIVWDVSSIESDIGMDVDLRILERSCVTSGSPFWLCEEDKELEVVEDGRDMAMKEDAVAVWPLGP